jgi:hypothetical protein
MIQDTAAELKKNLGAWCNSLAQMLCFGFKYIDVIIIKERVGTCVRSEEEACHVCICIQRVFVLVICLDGLVRITESRVPYEAW